MSTRRPGTKTTKRLAAEDARDPEVAAELARTALANQLAILVIAYRGGARPLPDRTGPSAWSQRARGRPVRVRRPRAVGVHSGSAVATAGHHFSSGATSRVSRSEVALSGGVRFRLLDRPWDRADKRSVSTGFACAYLPEVHESVLDLLDDGPRPPSGLPATTTHPALIPSGLTASASRAMLRCRSSSMFKSAGKSM
jgi:hypothetical protein